MILDPSRDGCTIWIGDKVVTGIKGTPEEACEQIYRRVVIKRRTDFDKFSYNQMYDLNIDTTGIGAVYKNILSSRYKLITNDIRINHIDNILPITLKDVENL